MTVDKNLFKSLLHRYSTSSEADVEQVLSLKNDYPYSQLLSTLAAKLMTDHNRSGHQQALQFAAVRAADRTVLKEVMENEVHFPEAETKQAFEVPYASHVDESSSKGNVAPVQSVTTPEELPVVTTKRIVSYDLVESLPTVDGFDLADRVMKDLERLNASRQNFEMLFVEYAEVKADGIASKDLADKNESGDADAHQNVREAESSKSRKQRIVELAKARLAAPSAAIETIEETKKKRFADGKASPNDELIKEIITTKEEISPENPKQKEQIDLINHFIKTQPSISSAKDKQPAPVTDLNPVKTGEFGDNIVSETLVEILIKQGKRDKAIEVLKKLIWKYPQKKAYFASQIEELKK